MLLKHALLTQRRKQPTCLDKSRGLLREEVALCLEGMWSGGHTMWGTCPGVMGRSPGLGRSAPNEPRGATWAGGVAGSAGLLWRGHAEAPVDAQPVAPPFPFLTLALSPVGVAYGAASGWTLGAHRPRDRPPHAGHGAQARTPRSGPRGVRSSAASSWAEFPHQVWGCSPGSPTSQTGCLEAVGGR